MQTPSGRPSYVVPYARYSARGACAIREVNEKCAISGHTIIKRISSSYHTYAWKGISFLKKTTWFLIQYDGEMVTEPQTEEGITKVEWLFPDELNSIKKYCMVIANGYYQLFSSQRLNN